MKTIISIIVTLVLFIWAVVGWTAELPPPVPAQEQPEVLTSGPMHEAFAEPVDLENQSGIVVPNEPPENIDEVPPDETPVGEEYVWISGYWGWDPSRNDYIWISGCWRAAPPGKSWVPGYWTAVEGGWTWVPGFWSSVDNDEIEYLPAPPPLTDVEPAGPVPKLDRIWVPPCWYWRNGEYILRTGYWIRARTDWIWVPSHYLWSPRGYVFVAGHWDYSFRRRGILFAPVFFHSYYHLHPGFTYSLSIVLDLGNLELGLFTYPRYHHYYYGDYYGDAFISIGIYPWFESVSRHTWYDPIYRHDRWRHFKTEPRWEEHERQRYKRLLANKELRPPRTYHVMETRLAGLPEWQRKDFRSAEPMSAFVNKRTTNMKFVRMKTAEREQIRKHSAEVHNYGNERRKWESQGPGAGEGRPAFERIPPAERRRAILPAPERRREEVSPPKVTPAPNERRPREPAQTERGRREVRPPEGREQARPVQEEKRAPAFSRRQRRPTSVSEGEKRQSERVRVPRPPFRGRKDNLKGLPSQPPEEQRARGRETPKKQEERKRGERDGDNMRRGR